MKFVDEETADGSMNFSRRFFTPEDVERANQLSTPEQRAEVVRRYGAGRVPDCHSPTGWVLIHPDGTAEITEGPA